MTNDPSINSEGNTVKDSSQGESHAPRFQRSCSGTRAFFRVCGEIIGGFMDKGGLTRSAALAYTSLLALVPLLAVVTSIYTSFLQNEEAATITQMIERVVENIAPQLNALPETDSTTGKTSGKEAVVNQIQRFINNINSRAIGVSGMITLIVVAILLLREVEASMNKFWGITHGRSWFSQIMLYWTALTLGPLALFAAIGITMKYSGADIQGLPFIGGIAARIAPFAFTIAAFTLFYQLMPNTKVKWSDAAVGGTVGGILRQVNNMLSAAYISRVLFYSKIYGSLGLIPLLLIGIYTSWVIVLFGNHICCAFQNRRFSCMNTRLQLKTAKSRELAALIIMTLLGKNFFMSNKPLTIKEILRVIPAEPSSIHGILYRLVNSGLALEIAGAEAGFSVARSPEHITCQDILEAARKEPDVKENGALAGALISPEILAAESEFNRITNAEREAATTITLSKIINEIGEFEKQENKPPENSTTKGRLAGVLH
ncbi:MAG: YihY family inner membrane protein [Verrucomicrobia bacterium]|nr:YihY family inner membrane protein [Verrucomicrobiota bacterium]